MTSEILTRQLGVYLLPHFGSRILAAFSGRPYGRERRHEFLRELGLEPGRLNFVKQVHGNRLIEIQAGVPLPTPEEGDGLVTTTPGRALGILTADCLPIFVAEPRHPMVGLIHAGWRGLQQGVISKAAQLLRDRYGIAPSRVQVVIGPAIRSCCYEVGEEFRGLFPRSYLSPSNRSTVSVARRRGRMDLIQEAFFQFCEAGFDPLHFFDAGICTSCQNARFFSARAGDRDERVLSVIQIRPEGSARMEDGDSSRIV